MSEDKILDPLTDEEEGTEEEGLGAEETEEVEDMDDEGDEDLDEE
jgi:hypothetical protein